MLDVGETLNVETGRALGDGGGGAEVVEGEFGFDDGVIGGGCEEAAVAGGDGKVGIGEAQEAVALGLGCDGPHGGF